MYTGDGYVSALSVSYGIKQKFPRAILVEHANSNTEHVNFLNLHRSSTLSHLLEASATGYVL
jgi:hypothetical protein